MHILNYYVKKRAIIENLSVDLNLVYAFRSFRSLDFLSKILLPKNNHLQYQKV